MVNLSTASNVIFRAITPGYTENGAKIDFAYVEFSNGETIAPEEALVNETNAETVSAYFQSLSGMPSRDYLRVPVTAHKIDSDNSLTVIVTADGTEGINGKLFSAGSGSRIYAVTLVASQSGGHNDILFARHVYNEDLQLQKPDNGAVVLTVTMV